MFNDSKNAVTLDLKKPAGIDLARRLMDWSDIVIENMRPGVMARLGLGYETARESNPSLVMISSCNMGQTGPRADTPGFGSQLSALAGFCGLTANSDGALVVISAGKTLDNQLDGALAHLEQVNGHVLGVIFNKVTTSSVGTYYGYYGYYGTYYGQDSGKKKGRKRTTESAPLAVATVDSGAGAAATD